MEDQGKLDDGEKKEEGKAEKGSATKLSFSLSPKLSSSSTPSTPASFSADEAATALGGTAGDSGKPQYVTVFDPSLPPSDAGPVVIPPIPNSYRPDLDAAGDGDAFDIANGIGRLTVPHSRTAAEGEEGEGIPRNEDATWQKLRKDLNNLPEDRGFREFEGIKLEDFGAAILRGYGWSEGQAVGRNKNRPDPKVVEFKRMDGSHGLGYKPSAGDPRKMKGNWVQKVQHKER